MTPRSPIQKTHPQERMRDRPPAHLSIPRAALAPRSRYAATPFVAIAAEEAFRSAMKSVRPLELTFQRLGAGRPGSGGQGKRPEERSDATNGDGIATNGAIGRYERGSCMVLLRTEQGVT